MRHAFRIALTVAVFLSAPVAFAGAHTWDVWEVFSNASGTIQFVELREANGTPGEVNLAGRPVVASPSGTTTTILSNVASPTSNKSYLIATAGFAALPGAPTPDLTLANPLHMLFLLSDTSVTYSPYDTASWTAGTLPTNGVNSLQRPAANQPLAVAVNSPTNYAGVTGSVNANPPAIPGVPGLAVSKLAADGSSLQVSFDTGTCSDGNDHQILYGQRSGFPAALGGQFTLLGGTCSIGTASPYAWSGTPSASDGSGLLWFVVVGENNAGKEGPWGRQTGGTERSGPGTNGSSNVCSITDKDTASTCGN